MLLIIRKPPCSNPTQAMKHLNQTGLRKLTIAGDAYLWKRHAIRQRQAERKGADRVIIFLLDHKQTPLELHFREVDNPLLTHTKADLYWCVGYPASGVIWQFNQAESQQATITINLNRPAVISSLITYFLQNGWAPRAGNKPMVVQTALTLLEIVDLPKGPL